MGTEPKMNKALLPIDRLPAILKADFASRQADFCGQHPQYRDWLLTQLECPHFAEQLTRCWLGSRYAAELCLRQPQWFKALVAGGLLLRPYAEGEMASCLNAEVASVLSAEALDAGLRQYRSRQMLRIIWRDINGLSDLLETTRDISNLAESTITLALDCHHRWLSAEYGSPAAAVEGHIQQQRMLVLGMGKLGARELNLSSDIDLIFCYPNGGATVDPAALDGVLADNELLTATGHRSGNYRYLDNHEFFTRLGQKVIQSLDKITADGFVFRVDMRLRPYGDSGALVLSFDAMEEYYQDQGRDWERYAMIKARVVAGDSNQGELLLAMLQPFVYRRYIDFSVIESLRSMKRMITQEVKRRRLHNDLKLGPGGIRDIEFIAQSFQLVRGGRDRDFQQRRLLRVLATLGEKALLPAAVVEQLIAAYVFLRHSEHLLQAFNDQQTQLLPVDGYPQSVLAFTMGYDSWQSYLVALNSHRQSVSECFAGIVSEPEESSLAGSEQQGWAELWLHGSGREQALELLRKAGHEGAEEVLSRLEQLRVAPMVERLQPEGRRRLDAFVPLLLQAVSAAEQPSATLLRIFPLIDAVLRRSAYLLLLTENPGALKQLVILCAGSPWIASQLSRHPVLLDELLDSRSLYQVPEPAQLHGELQQQMLRIEPGDLEGQMEGLRYFKHAHQLRVSAAEVGGQLPVNRVSDYLSALAEVILEHVLGVAWHFLSAKHGLPQGLVGDGDQRGFIIVGYGKLGGLELGHSSDLDLVFIHSAAANGSTDGAMSIDNTVFYTRLGQRIIHILSARTPMGDLYEVDMRLRPSGDSGPLVCSLQAFADYQYQRAWTWEHQAIVRARVVAGDQKLATDFSALRRKVLCQPREAQQLRAEVVEMRGKMREHLLPAGLESRDPPIFHLKHGSGAIVDIEFMVQYAVLAWAEQYPALAVYSDNIRILDALAHEGLINELQTQALIDAYKAFRARAHRLSLLGQPSEVPAADYHQQRQAVLDSWAALMT